MDEYRTEHRRGSGGCLPGDHQPRVVRANRNVAQSSLNSPCQRVIQSATLCHSPNHILPATSPHRNGPCLLDGSRLRQEASGPYCAARSAGSDPFKTCGFAAQLVFPNHTYCGVAPGEVVPPGRGATPSSRSYIRRPRPCPPRPGGADATNGACPASGWPGGAQCLRVGRPCSARRPESNWASMPNGGRLRS